MIIGSWPVTLIWIKAWTLLIFSLVSFNISTHNSIFSDKWGNSFFNLLIKYKVWEIHGFIYKTHFHSLTLFSKSNAEWLHILSISGLVPSGRFA